MLFLLSFVYLQTSLDTIQSTEEVREVAAFFLISTLGFCNLVTKLDISSFI